MKNNLLNYRKSYDKHRLEEETISKDPFILFKKWFKEVEDVGGVEEPNAMTISSLGLDGFPKSRVVLLKKFSDKGFTFYTNYSSEKGKAILEYPKVCLSFFWPNLERQIIIKGIAEKEKEDVSSAYFHSRPKGSQLGAWASNQSTVIPNRSVLENNLKQLEEKFKDAEIPKPTHWGGFLVIPESIEFWQGRPNRLHDRILYSKIDLGWKMDRLSP